MLQVFKFVKCLGETLSDARGASGDENCVRVHSHAMFPLIRFRAANALTIAWFTHPGAVRMEREFKLTQAA